MRIKSSVKLDVERFLSNYYLSDEEMGGFLIANRNKVVAFWLPMPNQSVKPRSFYQFPNGSHKIAEQFARSKKGEVAAEFHSHPTPCIMSAGDQCYAQANQNLTFVTITPTGEWRRCSQKEYLWYACRGIKPERIEEV